MASTEETGHAKNVANFSDLIQYIIKLGLLYNPNLYYLKLDALQQQLVGAKAAMLQLSKSHNEYSKMVDLNENAYAPVDKLITRSLNVLRASVEKDAYAETAEGWVKMLRGSRKTIVVENPDGTGKTVTKTISNSRRSYDMRNENFGNYIQSLVVSGVYQPNEPDISIAGLTNLLTELQNRSDSLTSAELDLNNARTVRNTALYAEPNGLVDVGQRVVKYIRGTLDPSNMHYKGITSLVFKSCL